MTFTWNRELTGAGVGCGGRGGQERAVRQIPGRALLLPWVPAAAVKVNPGADGKSLVQSRGSPVSFSLLPLAGHACQLLQRVHTSISA